MHLRKLLAKGYIRGLEEYAFTLEVMHFPKLSDKAIPKLYHEANRVRRVIGQKPKKYFTFKKRRVVPIKGV